jgi:hypothetical protein
MYQVWSPDVRRWIQEIRLKTRQKIRDRKKIGIRKKDRP